MLRPRRRHASTAWRCLALAALLLCLPAHAVWLDAAGRPNASAGEALRLLADAPSDGLAPADYRVDALARKAAALQAAAEAAPEQTAAFESGLDAALRRFAHDLHLGRIDPRTLGFRVPRRAGEATDFTALTDAVTVVVKLPSVKDDKFVIDPAG
jgi:hypothetical protein